MPTSSFHTPGFYGWRIVAVFGWGVGFYGPPVYLDAVRQARGWPIAFVSGAVTVHFLAGIAVVARLPMLHRRFGLPVVTFAGAVVLAVGVVGWAVARTPWQLYGAAVLSGAAWPTMGAAAVNAIVAPWFVTKRPAALSMAYNGASIGGVVFSPLWVALIGRTGFPIAAIVVGAGMIAVLGALAVCVLPRTPASMGQVPDGGREAGHTGSGPGTVPVRLVAHLGSDRAFVTLSAGMALALFAQIGLITQLVSLLVPPLGPEGAGLAAGLATSAAIVGRLAVGWTMPPGTDRRRVAVLSLLVQAAGCGVLMLADANAPLLLVGAGLVGLGIGNATSLPPLIAQVEFTSAEAPRVVALIVAISQGAYAFAPAAFGLLRQVGSDQAIFLVAIVVQLAAAGAYRAGAGAFARRSGHPERHEPAAPSVPPGR